MVQQRESTQLLLNVNALKGQASKTAYQGIAAAVSSIFIATLIVHFYTSSDISAAGIMHAYD